MSTLGFVAGKVDKEQTRLENLSQALLCVQVDTLGRAADLGLNNEDIAAAKRTLRDFVERLRLKLTADGQTGELSALAARLSAGEKPLEDWVADLKDLETHLAGEERLPIESIRVFEGLLSILDQELMEDFSRLYSH
jgi:hypothetical protein